MTDQPDQLEEDLNDDDEPQSVETNGPSDPDATSQDPEVP